MMNPSLPMAGPWQSDDVLAMQSIASPLRVGTLHKIILWMMGTYLVLNTGFEMVRIPPVGPGIPVGELVLALCLCLMSSRVLLPLMAKEVWLLPILIWWGLSLSRALIDAKGTGIWAFRDASQAIESLYLIVGFWFASNENNLQYFFRWIRRLLIVGAAYGLLYPLSDRLQNYSPHLSGIGTGATPLFFSMANAPAIMLWCAAWLLIDRPPGTRLSRDVLAGLLIAAAVAFGQSRSTYLQVLMIGAVLFLLKRKAAAKWGFTLVLGGLIIWAISISGLNLKGREHQQVSLDFIAHHFESISGTGGGGETQESAAAGVPLRIGWWKHIIMQLKSAPQKMVFGLGYGMPLTTFLGRTAVTREPHNSYVSVIGRLGVSGIVMWVLMQGSLYAAWWRSFRLCRRMQWTADQVNLLILLVFCLITLVEAVGEAAMEVPFYAIPYYFFFGVTLRYGKHLKLAAEREQMALFEQQQQQFDDGVMDAEPA
jgi:O-antigen ligase